jgi:coniferyl-aldehyde dehydrogenase
MNESLNTAKNMETLLVAQKLAFIKNGAPSLDVRKDRISRAIALLVDNRHALTQAICDDFGNRSKSQSDLTDILSSIDALRHAKKHMDKWAKPERRKTSFPLNILGARAIIENGPKGSVGIMSPWNFPISLLFMPLAGVLAAGNHAVLKPSEFTPLTSALLQDLIPKYFDPLEVAIFTGGPDIGAAFSALAFDHLVFTGSTSIAKHVMRAAAENLVPLTLELGGKSPTIVGTTADLGVATHRIMAAKTLNAGQICLAPDYVYVPHGSIDEFVKIAKSSIEKLYNGLVENDDYATVINERHFERLTHYVEDARAKGATIIEINPNNENFSRQENYKIPPMLILNATDEMLVMQDEIFGPLLPVKTYQSIQDCIDFINKGERPLALYYFGHDKTEEKHILSSTVSGGVTINDCIFHCAQEDLPFGGIGASGMGVYHGKDGFFEFSHRTPIYRQIKSEKILSMFRPPYGETIKSQMDKLISNK